jgi:D-mannonate dehydratase
MDGECARTRRPICEGKGQTAARCDNLSWFLKAEFGAEKAVRMALHPNDLCAGIHGHAQIMATFND